MGSKIVTLQSIAKSTEFTGLVCVCCEQYMNRPITGVHIIDNPDTIRFFRTGEVVLTTGYILQYFTAKELQDLMRHLCERGCSGVIFKINRFYDKVPGNIIQYAMEYDIPIVTIPYKYALADLQAYIHRQIFINDYNVEKETKRDLEEENYNDFLSILLKNPNECELLEKASVNDFDLSFQYFCIIVSGTDSFMKKMDIQLRGLIGEINGVCQKFSRINRVVYLIGKKEFDRENDISMLREELEAKVCSVTEGKDNGLLSVGDIVSEPSYIKRSVEHAFLARLYMEGKHEKGIVWYRDIEMLLIMYKDLKKERIEELYRNSIEPVVVYDLDNHTELIVTLEKLIDCGWDIKMAAEQLFIHRNTLLKRREKIEKLLKGDLGMGKIAALQIGLNAYNILKYLYE